MKCAEYDIILVLDTYDKIEAELTSKVQSAIANNVEMKANLKEEHTEELRKKDVSMKLFCDKNKNYCHVVNYVSCL